MAKGLELNEKLNEKSNSFIEKIKSEMHYQSDFSSDILKFEWVSQIEFACPYIDNIVRTPKKVLIKEQDTVKIEKAKKISVASIKDLSRHTHYIEKLNKKTNDVQPSRILIERSEETFNTYENRFVYTLICDLSRFMMMREDELENIEIKDGKTLEYAATTNSGSERINIELKITANETNKDDDNEEQDINKKIEEVKKRMETINRFIAGWTKSELYKSLEKENASKVQNPIKKTNVFLKNTDFQTALKLWDYLRVYENAKQEDPEEGLDTSGDKLLKAILDDAFLMDYFVLDSISASKREQKKKISEYAVILMHQQIKRVIEMLLNNKQNISDQEILDIIAAELKKERNKTEVDGNIIKDRFKSAIDEYIEKTQNYL